MTWPGDHPVDCDCMECSHLVRTYPQGADMPEEEKTQVLEAETLKASELYHPDAPKTLAELASAPKTEHVHRYHARAVQRIFDLDSQLRAAFEDLVKAQNAMHEVGIEIVTRFSKPMDSAWAAWKNEKR